MHPQIFVIDLKKINKNNSITGCEELSGLCSPRRDGLEDPLDDAGLVQQQLDQLSTIGRCEYEKTCALLVQLFDQAAQTYQELLQSTNSSAVDVTVQEGNVLGGGRLGVARPAAGSVRVQVLCSG